MDRYGVIGHPIAHSLSPFIHAEFAKQTQQKMTYEKFDVLPEKFFETIHDFQNENFKGLNITLPFKEEAFKIAGKLSDAARECGAVNTLFFTSNKEIFGDNTDGAGFVRDLTHNQHYSLSGKKILLIGAGGASREIIPALLKLRPTSITLTNRSDHKALELAEKFTFKGEIHALPFSKLTQENAPFDLIINASSGGITGPFPECSGSLIHSQTWCYDLVYNPNFPSFLNWAKSFKPENCLDGLGMLIEQAALAFYLWRGVAPKTAPVIEMIKSRLL